jgi:probable rRNA maturation factor
VNSRIQFFSEKTPFVLKNKTRIRTWLVNAILEENKAPWYINFIFCDDEFLHELNVAYLNHKSYTDILTFSFSEEDGTISGDIYISVDRVDENALKFGQIFSDELHRVMIHGILHLIGYRDKTKKEKEIMRMKETYFLEKLN